MIRALVVAFVSSLVAGCTCAADPAGAFACVRDDQCVDGYVCLSSRCQPAKTSRCPVVSCEVSDCEGLACNEAQTQYCQRGICACIEAGGVPQLSAEKACGDGHDNDCDGKFDCFDSDCFAACDAGTPTERTDSGVVDAGAPDSGMPGPVDAGAPRDAGQPETDCANGLDDDGDALTDCADPDCETRSCPGVGRHVCCSGGCVNPASSAMHCGGCGLRCGSGQTCNSLAIGAGRTTGTCTCSSGNSCPMGQSCAALSCTCSASSMCAPNGVCDFGGGLNGYCRVN